MRNSRHRRILIAFISAFLSAPVVSLAASGVEQDTPISNRLDPSWRDAIQLLDQSSVLAERISVGAAPEALQVPLHKLADWFRAWSELDTSRWGLSRTDFEMYVSRANKWRAQGKIDRALDYALRAFHNTRDKDAFRKESWLAQLRKDAQAKAQEDREAKNWLDAHAIYYELSEIFDQDQELKDLRHECLTHARLEELYKKDSRWEESLKGIDPEMVTEALWRIDQKYVTEADFRALTEAGLKQVLLLADSPALRELFEYLRDDDRRQEFVQRLQVRLAQVRAAESLDRRTAVRHFNRMLSINGQTVQLPEALLTSEFAEGALDELDEFTSVIWPAEYKEFRKHTQGNFIGVGISIRQKYNSQTECNDVVVVSPIEDSPAYAAGVQADDVITHVDGKSLCEMNISLSRAVEMITGPEGTHVRLTLYRPGEDRSIEMKLERRKVVIQSVKGDVRDQADEQKWNFMLDPDLGIGYMRVTNFQENTVDELRTIITDLKNKHNLRGLILDLRFNPGGLLQSAVEVAELFLRSKQRIVSTQGLRSRPWEIDTRNDGPFRDLPLIVLVNEYSASASEIVSGAIRDHHRGVLIGERTFGKFSVQNLIQLVRSDAHLKLTTAHYFLPSGRSLHKVDGTTEWGVEPDVAVALVPKEIRRVLEIRRDTDVIGPRGKNNEDDEEEDELVPLPRRTDEDPPRVPATQPAPGADEVGPPTTQPVEEEPDEPDPNNYPRIDPQLEAALLLMRVRLTQEDYPAVARYMDEISTTPATAALNGEKVRTQ